MSTTIMPVDLPPTHSPCKNASYALRPCNLPWTDNSIPIRDAYSHNYRFNYYRTGCWEPDNHVEVLPIGGRSSSNFTKQVYLQPPARNSPQFDSFQII